MNGQTATHNNSRLATERGLAVVGFIALVAFGIWLAVYSAQFVPTTVDRLGAAAVALTSVFRPASPTLSVIPNASTTIPFGDSTTTPVVIATSTATVPTYYPYQPYTPPPVTKPTPVATTPGPKTGGTYAIGTSTAPVGGTTPYGLADLTANITATGYLTSPSTDTFIATSTAPLGTRPAVRFTIKNVGTNVAPAGWHFSASIPTQNAYVFYSPAQPLLNPGDSIDYILGFDQAYPGVNQSISIIANSDHSLGEATTANNSSTATITIRGI